MLWSTALSTFLLLSFQPSIGVYGDVIKRFQHADVVTRAMRRYAEAMVEEEGVERRQSAPNSQMNATKWDAQTAAACEASLATLNGVASNPAGMAVCYNLPYLDNSTGIFQADLRLYMISDPTGDFSGVPADKVSVGLQYFGASVQTISPSELKRRDIESRPYARSESERRKRDAMQPSLLQSYAFIGQINKNLMSPNMNA
jgi:hypothetical protein